jgi:hypothetical protein
MLKAQIKVVEFFGVPGVGKSYLFENSLSRDQRETIEIYVKASRCRRFFRKLCLILRNLGSVPLIVFWSLRFVRFGSPPFFRLLKIIFNLVFVDCLIRESARQGKRVLVMDQGIAQALWSTCFGGAKADPVQALLKIVIGYLRSLPITSWEIFWVTSSKETLMMRIISRVGNSPIDRKLHLLEYAFVAENYIGSMLNNLSIDSDNPIPVSIFQISNNDDSAISAVCDLLG